MANSIRHIQSDLISGYRLHINFNLILGGARLDRYFFIINKRAGNGNARKIWEKLKDELSYLGLDHRSFFTEKNRHGEHLAQQIAELAYRKNIIVVVIGGDGTLHEVVNGLAKYPEIPIKFIPAGTCNDFARSLQIKDNKLTNNVETIDVGVFQSSKKERIFVSSLGVGLDAEIAEKANLSALKPLFSKLKLGFITYCIILVKSLFTYKPNKVTLLIDGRTYHYHKCWFVTISNLPYYGGGMKISPTASPRDGKLNICVVNNIPRWKMLLLFSTVFFGKHNLLREVKMLTGKHITVQSEIPLPIHVDGEYGGKTPVIIHVKERRLNVMV